MNDYIVETHGLTKRFGSRVAVDGVDLRVPRGSAFGYLGPNGAGKTTLIRMLLGLTRASEGSMRLLGRPVPAERAEALARVGAIVEEPRFHPFLTGRENLEVVAAARDAAGVRADRRRARPRRPRRTCGRAREEVLARDAAAARRRAGAARRPGAPDPRRADERPRSGRDPRVPRPRAAARRRRAHRRALVAPPRRGREDLRRRRDRRPRPRRVAGADRRDPRRWGATLLVEVDDVPAALAVLGEHAVEATADGLRVALRGRRPGARSRRRSTARSSRPASPSVASSSPAPRSRSGSWRSRPDWRKQHEADPRGAPEAAEAARARRRRGRRDDRPRRDRLHRPLDPARVESGEKYDPAGGIDNFTGSIELLTQIGVVAAILIGATAGAGDRGAGVFRELVVTGRSRLALFAARARRARAPAAVRRRRVRDRRGGCRHADG